jgi:hypothetical protein
MAVFITRKALTGSKLLNHNNKPKAQNQIMKITEERRNGNLTNVYHISDTCLLRATVNKINEKGEPIATLVNKGRSDEVIYPAAILYYLNNNLPIPEKYFPCVG